MKARLVVLEVGYDKWSILGPSSLFGDKWDDGRYEDVRYEELCVVSGPIRKAFDRVAELERGRQ